MLLLLKSWESIFLRKIPQRVKQIILIAAASLLYGTVLFIFPVPLQVSAAFHNISLALSCLVLLYLTLVLSRKGWIWQVIPVFLVLGLFTLPLIYRWQTGFYQNNIVGGLLPWSDALDYYIDAQQLILGQRFTETSTKRPFFTGFLSVLLAVTNRNLQLTLALLLLLNALSFYFLAREIQRSYGSLAAAFSLVFLYLFAQRFTGLTMTENLGMCLGALGLTSVLRGARERKASFALIGLFIIAVGLVARAGAFFFLPAVVIWGAFYFRETKRISFQFLIAGIFLIVSAFSINFLLVKIVGMQNGTAFSNYSFTLYGLASGNKGWEQVYQDYPGITESEIWGVAFQKVKDHPILLIEGISGALSDYFHPLIGAYSFLDSSLKDERRIFTVVMWILSVLGIVSLFVRKDPSWKWLLIWGFLGIMLSVCLIPPIDADRARVLASTMPFTALFGGVGLALPFSLILSPKTRSMIESGHVNSPSREITSWLGLAIVAASTIGPIVVMCFGSHGAIPSTPACSENQRSILIDARPGTYIVIVPDSAVAKSYLPYIKISDIRRSVAMMPATWHELGNRILDIEANTLIISEVNKADLPKGNNPARNIFLITNTFPQPGGKISVCGNLTSVQWLKPYGFYNAFEESEPQVNPKGLYYINKTLDQLVSGVYGVLFLIVTALALWQLARSHLRH